jgi:quercetin dioxygenase-like cupin family protein
MQTQDIHYIPAGCGERVQILGAVHTNKLTPDRGRGAFAALEIAIPPRCGPPVHRHAADSECFYVLEGEITFESPSGTVVGRPGDFCFLPTGGAHGFRNDGETLARAFVVVSPGVEAHAFFHEVGERLNGAIDVPVVEEVAARNGITFLPPSAH